MIILLTSGFCSLPFAPGLRAFSTKMVSRLLIGGIASNVYSLHRLHHCLDVTLILANCVTIVVLEGIDYLIG